MFLDKLELKNFRGFESMEIEFPHRLTVLIGANGSGKSSVLDAAAIAASSFFHNMEGVQPLVPKEHDVRMKTIIHGDVADPQRQYPTVIRAKGKILGRDCTWERSLTNAKSSGRAWKEYESIKEISREAEAAVRRGDTDAALPLIAYYRTGRLWGETRKAGSSDAGGLSNRFDAYKGCLDAHLDTEALTRWFHHMALREVQEKKPPVTYLAVREAVERCFSSLAGCEAVHVEFSFADDAIRVDQTQADGTRTVNLLSELSDGYRCALCLIADIAYRCAMLNPQYGSDALDLCDGVVLVDEIDLHLHPAWQQRIIRDLTETFPRMQFIVSTHAPAVVGSVKRESMAVINDGAVINPVFETYGRDVNSLLTGVMGAQERASETAELFVRFYSAMDQNEFEYAAEVLGRIESIIGPNDPEATACAVQLDLERM